jgi:hypothetical protein
MRLYYSLLALFAIICTVSADVTVEYTKNGVLRKNNKCNVNFVNFGIGDTIKNINVSKSGDKIIIEGLKDGNEGQNNEAFKIIDNKNYILVTQGKEKKEFTITKEVNGLFSIEIKNIKSCDGLTVKQTYKLNVLLHTYLLYVNKIPDTINSSFPADQFGPSSNGVPYDTLYWDMNKGLDEIRENCGIFIDYRERNSNGGYHYKWYLSTENINLNNCSNEDFYKIVRKNYPKYDKMYELFGDYYEGYVLKRESSKVGHMDGIIKSNFIIEVYHEACGTQSDNQVICTISSQKKLKFQDFTDELMKNCLSIIVDKDEVGKWSANESYVDAQFENYSIRVENNGEGSLPTSKSDVVEYKTFKAVNSSGVARFKVSLICKDGTYRDDKCRCQACSLGCKLCTGKNKCTECNHGTLTNDKCVCDTGYFMSKDGVCQKCGEDCKTCKDAETCDSCIDPIKELKEGKCECPAKSTLVNGKCECEGGYFMKDGKCEECGDDCITCKDAETCDSCIDPVKKLVEGKCICPENSTLKSGKCECDAGYFMNNDGVCQKCGDDCKTCSENAESCDSCYEPRILVESEKKCVCPTNSSLKEGKCICKDGYYMDEGECKVCGPDCKTCKDANTCTECANPKKKLNNGKCECKENHHMNDEGQCICDEGFYSENNECVACVGDCKTCKSATFCEKCNDPLKKAKDGVCECIDGYYMKEGKCEKCTEGCSKCIENKCLECEGEGKVPGEEGKCKCDKSFYEDSETHECKYCNVSCATCNQKGKCTSCKDTRAVISDGVCVCKNSALNEDGYCIVCDKSCAECDAHGCVTCADSTKTPDENGNC